MSESTTPGQPEVAYNTDADAAQALLDRWGIKDDEPSSDESGDQEAPEAEATDEPADEQADEATAEAAGDDEGEDAEVQDEVEIDLTGEKFKLPGASREQAEAIQRKVKELEAGTTRKFQEVAERDKAVAAKRETLERMEAVTTQRIDLIAAYQNAANRINAIRGMDLRALNAQDPVKAQELLIELNEAAQTQGQIEKALQQVNAEYERARQQDVETRVNSVREYVKSMKGWSPEVDAKLAGYADKDGWAPADRTAVITSPKLYEMAMKAMQYDTLQQAKPQVTKRAAEAPKPALKPSARTSQQSAQKAKEAEALGRLRKSGHINDAAAALLARMRKG